MNNHTYSFIIPSAIQQIFPLPPIPLNFKTPNYTAVTRIQCLTEKVMIIFKTALIQKKVMIMF